MPDGAIVIPDTAAAPKDYTLAGSQEIQLKSVSAEIDGTGAASAFKPTLQMLDPNGHVCWEGEVSDAVAAGASVRVSWFPGLGSTGSTGGAAWFFASRVTNQNILSANLNRISWTHHVTSDPTVFSVTTHTLADDQVNGLKAGIYIAVGQLEWASPKNYAHYAKITTDFFGVAPTGQTPASDSATDQTEANRSRSVGDSMIAITQAVPGEISLEAGNNDGVTHAVTQALYAIAYLPNSVAVS